MTNRRRKRARKRSGLADCGLEDELALWTLRALSRVGRGAASGPKSAYDLELLASLGVELPTQAANNTQDRPALHAAIVAATSRAACRRPAPCMASANAAIVGRMLGLSRVEVAVLALTIAFDADDSFASSFALLRARGLVRISQHVAAVLGLRADAVLHALRRAGRLRSLGLVQLTRIDGSESGPLTLRGAVYSVLLRPLQDEEDVLTSFLEQSARPSLTSEDYPHLTTDIGILQRVLGSALARREQGVNILLYGPPGTGKTELARTVADSIGARLDEVKLVDSDDDARDGNARLESYALCQRMLWGRGNIALLFDEAEDAFPRDSAYERLKSGRNKAWTNRLLEQNPIPTIWVSNAIDQIDRAFLRRFDFLLEVAEPPRSVRRRVLEKHLRAARIAPATLERLAERDDLSPGHVQHAGRVVRLLRATGRAGLEPALVRVVESNLRAYAGAPRRTRQQNVLRYDPTLLRTDIDAAQLVAGLARSRAATLCFYGPPGTGKTQLAHHIARQLDLPILDYRASDLLSKWVGDTERAIAAMFERATSENAVLLLDEADGLIVERSHARSTWEVTQVNEMLTQMEQFTGIFICSTNLLDRIDRAALRRFAIKVRFDYLRAEQAELLLREVIEAWCHPGTADEDALDQVRRMRHLTPGDFAAVVRRLRILGERTDRANVVRCLREEVAVKRERGGKALGFGA